MHVLIMTELKYLGTSILITILILFYLLPHLCEASQTSQCANAHKYKRESSDLS